MYTKYNYTYMCKSTNTINSTIITMCLKIITIFETFMKNDHVLLVYEVLI